MPDSTESRDATLEDRLKSTLWYHVGQIVDEETFRAGTNATPQYIGSLTELVWAQISNVATDLESFAKHAGRYTIKTDDVLLLARRNSALEDHLKGKVEELRQEHMQKAKHKKSTNGPAP